MQEFSTIEWIMMPFMIWFGYKWIFVWLPMLAKGYWNEILQDEDKEFLKNPVQFTKEHFSEDKDNEHRISK